MRVFDFVRRLGRKPSKPPPAAVAYRPRDCHSHVLWGVDDGARTRDEAIEMLRLLRQDGARRIVATPHIYPGRFPNEPGPLRERFEELCRARDEAGIDVELELGAEHFLDETLVRRVEDGAHVCFGPERYVLFEAHTGPTIPVHLDDAVRAIVARGQTPLLAHVERYRWARGEEGWEVLADLRAVGVRFQVNRTVGHVNVPGEGSRGRAIARLLEEGWVDEVGSDLHRPTADGRPDPYPSPAA
ncbi:MAG: histidinol-phosphatase [Deltaproteobacteria bacterium]|nr:MAG: histidinol-phosphatase [Deltaproteobacteria bacterium]